MGKMDFKLDASEIEKFGKEFGKKKHLLAGNLRKVVVNYGLLVEEGSRALAQEDGGDLVTSINVDPLRINGGIITGSVTASAEYAMRRHEEPYTPGTRPKYDKGVKEEGYYKDGLGRRTREKPAWRGEKPGRKFMTRAVDITEDDYNKGMDNALDSALRGESL